MDIYSIELKKEKNTYKKIFNSLIRLSIEYERRVLIGVNIINFTDSEINKIKYDMKNTDAKFFLGKEFPPTVFSFIAKYKMCDFSVCIMNQKDTYKVVIFGGSGYPICSYQKRAFLRYIDEYKRNTKKGKGDIFNLNLNNGINTYIKHIFGKNKNIQFIKNAYDLYYFKVNGNYYVLDKFFTKLVNKTNDFILEKMKNIVTKTYNFSINDDEFDPYLYIKTRKIACILLQDGSILFDSSYYIDYLKLVYYLEFVC